MQIVEVRERSVPIASPISNAVISFAEMTVSLVAVISDVVRHCAPVVGFGFNSNGRYAQSGLLRERFVPRLLAVPEEVLVDSGGRVDPIRVQPELLRNEKPGGHGERAVAVGILDMALWDLAAKLEDLPLAEMLARRLERRKAAESVWVYAAGGYYYPGKDLRALREEVQRYLDAGFTTVKMKVGGAPLDQDLERVAAVADVVGDPARVAVDANGRFELREALTYAEALAPWGLAWLEEPCDPLDYAALAQVAEVYPGPLATGENLLSWADSRNLLRHGGLRADRDVLQMDPALSYGLSAYLQTLKLLDTHGWSRSRCVPHGGHQLNLAMAAALGLGGCEAYPGTFEPFGSLPEETPVVDGRIGLSDAPGIGFERSAALRPLLEGLLD